MVEHGRSEHPSPPVPVWLEDQWAAASERIARWKVVAFCLAVAVWSIPSMFVGLIGLVGLVGWEGDNGATTGLADGDMGGFAALALAGICDLAACVSLVAIARWALAGDRRRATVHGVVGTFWAQVLAAGWLVVT